MPTSIPNNSLYIKDYKEIIELLKSPIDINKLPVTGECKIFKMSAEAYGHVIIKLDVETDESIIQWGHYYTYDWIPAQTCEGQSQVIIPLDAAMEIIKEQVQNEITVFVTLLELLNDNTQHLRFSVIGGSQRIMERPVFGWATAQALIQIIKKLHDKLL